MKPASTALLLLFGMFSVTAGAHAASLSPGCAAAPQIRLLVADALHANGFATANAQVPAVLTCPSAIRAGEDLEVARVKWDALVHSFEVRLRCKSARACLPFVVRIPADLGAKPHDLNRNPAGKWEASASRNYPLDTIEQRSLVVVKPGEKVTLLWQENGMRITRSVICLEPGRKGQQVRTRAMAGGPILRARVLKSGWVEAQP